MDAAERREKIMALLRAGSRPVSAASLASSLSVSRQIIVGDIALLRASGEKITATPRGYVLEAAAGKVYTIACIHGLDDTEKELNIMVDNGCTVINVTVEHPIYGQLTGQLRLSSRYDVSQFMEKLRNGEVAPLCQLTGGVHLHALSCPDEDCFERTRTALAEAGLLYE
ncbi:MAG: HTH domain-containing protein [Oscillospiraceae bacterium]|nr:HTH domain-containing protein [Oscillospiraceae bacterium]